MPRAPHFSGHPHSPASLTSGARRGLHNILQDSSRLGQCCSTCPFVHSPVSVPNAAPAGPPVCILLSLGLTGHAAGVRAPAPLLRSCLQCSRNAEQPLLGPGPEPQARPILQAAVRAQPGEPRCLWAETCHNSPWRPQLLARAGSVSSQAGLRALRGPRQQREAWVNQGSRQQGSISPAGDGAFTGVSAHRELQAWPSPGPPSCNPAD